MDILHERAAGIDISKRDAKVCVRIPGKRKGNYASEVRTWGSTTGEILALHEFLIEQGVTTVVMEATGDYWKPFYFVLEDGLSLILANARLVKNIPGRKTDVSDAAWLAQLGAYGLVRASFVPPEPIRQLRDLTRARAAAVRDRSHVVQRLEKFLECSGIKLSAVVSHLSGVSARLILDALIDGERDPQALAELAKGALRRKLPELVDALEGRFNEHHAFLTRRFLDQYDLHTHIIEQIDERIGEAIAPFRDIRDMLTTIPGVSELVANVIIAETGADMDVFETPGHLASWAGVCPGSNQSADRTGSTRTRPGNAHLKAALGTAALSIAQTHGTYFAVKYRRIASRRGPIKAIVAIEHAILTATWHMLRNGEAYIDPGADFYTKLDPQKTRNKAIRQLEILGYQVAITPAAA